MKKIFCLAFALLLALSVGMAAAEGRTAPEIKKTIVTSDLGVETLYNKPDNKFYDAPSGQPGEIVKVEYTTTAYGEPLNRFVNVYVPYGYDAGKQYNIIYFLHGTNELQDALIGDERAKNFFDNMIEVGVADPFLMVFPTYYYDYENRAIDIPAFRTEMREAIMPAVESRFSTYAPTADTEGFAASREHRAISGYSRGAYATWHMLDGLLDCAKWWLPMSAAISGAGEMEVPGPSYSEQVAWLSDVLAAQPGYDYFLYICCGGGRDMMNEFVNGLVKEMVESGSFSYGMNPAENNMFYALSQEVHQTLMALLSLTGAAAAEAFGGPLGEALLGGKAVRLSGAATLNDAEYTYEARMDGEQITVQSSLMPGETIVLPLTSVQTEVPDVFQEAFMGNSVEALEQLAAQCLALCGVDGAEDNMSLSVTEESDGKTQIKLSSRGTDHTLINAKLRHRLGGETLYFELDVSVMKPNGEFDLFWFDITAQKEDDGVSYTGMIQTTTTETEITLAYSGTFADTAGEDGSIIGTWDTETMVSQDGDELFTLHTRVDAAFFDAAHDVLMRMDLRAEAEDVIDLTASAAATVISPVDRMNQE